MSDLRPTFAVVLSGCGVYDGSEVHEAVLTLLAIERHGARYRCFAPNIRQTQVIDHLTGAETGESRNVLSEAARIARGKIDDLETFDAATVDALILPGGFGAAKNLCSFAFDGPDCSVDPGVERAVRAMVAAGKPIGALCIAPALIAKILDEPELTIGNDAGTAAAIETMGGTHRTTSHGEVVIDHRYGLVTSPCYMLDSTIGQIADGASNTVKAMLDLISA